MTEPWASVEDVAKHLGVAKDSISAGSTTEVCLPRRSAACGSSSCPRSMRGYKRAVRRRSPAPPKGMPSDRAVLPAAPAPGEIVRVPQRQYLVEDVQPPPEPGVLEELVDLGVLSIRQTGKIDVPDIYRYGFKIKRKGGVARPK